jgi:hypothetical protein
MAGKRTLVASVVAFAMLLGAAGVMYVNTVQPILE